MKWYTKKFEARRRPSVEKFQYLLHLKDCVESGKSDVRHNLLQLEEIDQYLSGLASLNPEAHHITFRKQLYQDDFKYLQTSLEKLGEGIDRLQNEARPSVGKRIKLTWLVDREAERTEITEHNHAYISGCCVCPSCFRHCRYSHTLARRAIAMWVC